MTRIFVCEYTCAASSGTDGAASLRAEGEAMLRAVLADFRRIPGVEAFTVLAEPDEEAVFRAAARSADWSLIIAPEFHDILLTRCRWVLQEGGRLLGPSPAAVKLCGDKLALFQSLGRYGCRIPETRPAVRGIATGWPEPFVRKPRFGAGSLDTYLVDPQSDLPMHDSPLGEMIEQSFVPGLPVSVSFLTGSKDGIGLVPCEQRLSADGRFRYRGGRLPLPPDLAKRAQNLAKWTIQYLPNAYGWIGVDLVLG
ncbi:MAG: ATP-grasp domain-containing protein, partial [Gemmataceae bacterium]